MDDDPAGVVESASARRQQPPTDINIIVNRSTPGSTGERDRTLVDPRGSRPRITRTTSAIFDPALLDLDPAVRS